jgi:gamma-glutamylcyclotransferase (GGCT)/AIG2-like uncharacterized protein YtfP
MNKKTSGNKKTEMDHLFAYGTLMCEDIMEEVAGCRLDPVPGTLGGYSRRSVKGEHYPALVPDRQGIVEGILYRDVPARAWDRLDRFEGEMYARRWVRISLPDGSMVPAATYVTRPEFLDCLEAFEWDFASFRHRGKAAFQRQYKGYKFLY